MPDIPQMMFGIDPASGRDRTVIFRGGTEFVTEIYPEEDWRLLPNGAILIIHPDRIPQIILPGERRILPPEDAEA